MSELTQTKLQCKEWQSYLRLLQERPGDFSNAALPDQDGCPLEIVTDLDGICAFEQRSGKRIGVMYESPFHLLLVDLVRTPQGRCFAYERVLPAKTDRAVVCLTRMQDRFVLLQQYRHSMRGMQYGFVRGYGEPGLDGAANAAKELTEELGTAPRSVKYLGTVVADSGLCGNSVAVYDCEITGFELKKGYEEIENVVCLSREELNCWISEGKITDGYTLSALGLLLLTDHT